MRNSLFAGMVSVSALALAGCGGEDGSAPPVTSVTPTPTPTPTATPTPTPTPTPTVQRDIEYRSAPTQNGQMPLLLDIYQPDSACAANRPTIVFVHGGSFIVGNKDSAEIRLVAEGANARGFNFVSIQYRLQGDAPLLSAEFTGVRDDLIAATGGQAGPRSDAIAAAFEDTTSALNWLESNAGTYCLDMSNYALWGSSAGSFAVMQVAYGLNQFGITRPEPRATVNYWGGLFRSTDLETGEAPVLTLHGTADTTVDYQNALDVADRADDQGVNNALYGVIGADHAWGAIDVEQVQFEGRSVLDLSLDFAEAHITSATPVYRRVEITP